MPSPVHMPQLGESVAEGTIGRWLKSIGDRVEKDESLVEIITDKVNAEIPSALAGTVTDILAQEGETVPVGQPIAMIDEDTTTRRDLAQVQATQESPPATAGAPINRDGTSGSGSPGSMSHDGRDDGSETRAHHLSSDVWHGSMAST
jgi:pyruvate/2-oxoglutarate dehydrogenase complex dihydrolipoamide acyltransferase (E2) component